MGTNTSGLRRGGPGRPKGAKNKATLARDFVQAFREFQQTETYHQNWQARVLRGRAAHLETIGIKLLNPEANAVNLTGKLVIEWEK